MSDGMLLTGSTVTLKSGGVIMTVEKDDGSRIVCSWFDSAGALHRDYFPRAALVRAAKAQA